MKCLQLLRQIRVVRLVFKWSDSWDFFTHNYPKTKISLKILQVLNCLFFVSVN